MKEIIYLDTDLIHSFLAQIHNGLPGESSNERSQQVQESTESLTSGGSDFMSGTSINTGKISVPFLIDTPEGKVEVTLDLTKGWQESSSITQIEAGKELISKKLHDNALEEFVAVLESKNMLQDIVVAKDNNFVKFNSPIQIFNLEYLSSILDPEMLPKIMFHEAIDEIDKLKRTARKISNKNERETTLKEISKSFEHVEEAMSDGIKEFEFLKTGLDFMDSILPTKTFGKFNKSFSYIKPSYLREDPKVLMFKYANQSADVKATIIGKKIRKISASEESPEMSSLFSAPLIIDYMLVEMDVAKDGDFLVAPIAIYFE